MKFEELKSDKPINGKCGDVVEIRGRVYVIKGYTNFGKSYLVGPPDEYKLFKVTF